MPRRTPSCALPPPALAAGAALVALALAGAAACGGGSRAVRLVSSPSGPRTQAERTGYRETSSHASVVAFVDSLTRLGVPVHTGVMGRTIEGRDLPYIVASRPPVATPDEARRSGRPVVFVQGNIHSGEVEGKEALQALVRDLLLDRRANVLDSIVLIAVPNYNADGNERLAPQARNRGSQNGPELVGTRPNASGLNLNRDYTKADAPETKASLAMFNAWDPHVFVDLHTTDGSYHGYNLTYAPSLNPAAELRGYTFGGAWARDSFLPELRRRLRSRHSVEAFDYGNFGGGGGGGGGGRGGRAGGGGRAAGPPPAGITPAAPPAEWRTYEHVPRFGTNYYALRGRISILSETYSHDPFERRVRSAYAFTRELLSLVAERAGPVMELARRSDDAMRQRAGMLPAVPVAARMTETPFDGPVSYEEVERMGDTVRYEAGMPPGMRRTGRFRTATMKIFDRFTPTVSRPAPWGYAIAPSDTAAVNLVRLHGIEVRRLDAAWQGDAGPQFVVDSTVVAPNEFEGRRLVRLAGRWVGGRNVSLAAGTWVVPVGQPLGVVAMYLLEPESDDGIVAWDIGEIVRCRRHRAIRPPDECATGGDEPAAVARRRPPSSHPCLSVHTLHACRRCPPPAAGGPRPAARFARERSLPSPDHSRGDEATIGGYMAVHARPAAFEGSDGLSYSVAIETDRTGDVAGPWGAYFLFVRWRRIGRQGVEGHLETPFLARAGTASEAAEALGAMPLGEVKAILDGLIRERGAGAGRRWWDVMRDEDE